MLLIIQSYVMPAISRRECGCFCALLITILIAKIPVSRFHRKYSNTGFVEYFCVITTPGATPSGSGCYVTGFAPTLNGTRTDKDEDGNVTGTTNVSFAISFNTARFENADQINAFGGKNGVLSGLHYKKQNLLMIGTVKNDLLGALQSAAANTNEAFHDFVDLNRRLS